MVACLLAVLFVHYYYADWSMRHNIRESHEDTYLHEIPRTTEPTALSTVSPVNTLAEIIRVASDTPRHHLTTPNKKNKSTTKPIFSKQCVKIAAKDFVPLSQSTVEGVENFVFFVGYKRSGNSMIGSVMDSHPNMIIAHEYFVFRKCKLALRGGSNVFTNKSSLFDKLYKKSYYSAKCGWRSDKNTKKGYNFNFNSTWQSAFSQLKVIGDKAGGSVSREMQHNGEICLHQMIASLHLTIIAIHVVRNPYDMIATEIAHLNDKRKNSTFRKKRNFSAVMQMTVARNIFMLANSVVKVKTHVPVVEMHIEDFIQDPSRIIMKLCHSLGVDCPQEYVDRVTAKAYKNVSRSRDLISWSPSSLTFIDQQMTKYPFFEGYTFEDSFRHEN